MTTETMVQMHIELPAVLIHALHQRKAWLREELARLVRLRAEERVLHQELVKIQALLETYGLPVLADPMEVEDTLEVHEVAEDVAEEAPLETAAPLAGPALVSRDRVEGVVPAEAPPEAGPCADLHREPATLECCVDALLRAQGPASVPYLHRALLATGFRVAPSTLRDHLVRGMREGRYAKTRQTWRLAPREASLEEVRP